MENDLVDNVWKFLNNCSQQIGDFENDMFSQNTFSYLLDNEIISPIEQLLYCAIQTIMRLNLIDKGEPINVGDKTGIIGLACLPQVVIGKYRVDFEVYFGKYDYKIKDFIYKKVIVECDSQEFHERTEKERRYEKERDRFLIKENYHVFHFTGKEIYHNPIKIAREIISYVSSRKEEDIQTTSGD